MIRAIICSITLLIVMHFWLHSSFADYRDPEVRTHVNKQTSYLKDTLGDEQASIEDFTGNLDKSKAAIGSSDKALSDISEIVGSNKNEVIQESDHLSEINADDLESKGREGLIKENVINDLYVDYSKPLNKQHAKDAELLANAQNDLFTNLFGKMRELGVDCKTVKGDKVQEPEYYIQIKTTQHKDTIYNQTFCEELRNKYNCRDSLALRCTKKGIRWNAWQDKTVKIDGDTIYRNANHLGYSIKWKRKRHGWHLKQDSAGWRQFLSSHLNIPIEQIHEQIHFPNGARGVGSATHPVYERWRIVFDQYEFKYKYREGTEICEKWDEQWTERCSLQ